MLNTIFSRLKEYYIVMRLSFQSLIGIVIRLFSNVQPGLVLVWSDDYAGYGCNPRAISDFLLSKADNYYSINWVFRKPEQFSSIDERIHKVKYGTLKHFILVNTAEFLVTNHRTNPIVITWKKRKGQKYVMTWHGSMGVKKAEADMNRTPRAKKVSQMDSSYCDIMLSDSQWYDNIIRTQLEFQGPILKKGIPRNDIYFDKNRRIQARNKVLDFYGISKETKIVLYAPTFRNDYSFDAYYNDWEYIKDSLKMMLKGDVLIVLRYHQVMKRFNISSLDQNQGFVNATSYDNMQELLCAADLLITDYSSTMFDMGLINKPCILYASDINNYDRGFYFDLRKLPMPLAENKEELRTIIEDFDFNEYINNLELLYKNVFKVYEMRNACEAFYNWMNSVSLSRH